MKGIRMATQTVRRSMNARGSSPTLARNERFTTLTLMAMMLLGITGLIHLIEMPDNYSDAAYKGILFLLNGIAAAIATYGIYRGARWWGWGLGLLVTGGAFVMYFISRTIGLPGVGVDPNWTEQIGILSLIVEVGFFAVAYLALTMPTAQPGRGRASSRSRTRR
jgi:hypothetical protein